MSRKFKYKKILITNTYLQRMLGQVGPNFPKFLKEKFQANVAFIQLESHLGPILSKFHKT